MIVMQYYSHGSLFDLLSVRYDFITVNGLARLLSCSSTLPCLNTSPEDIDLLSSH